MAQSSSTETSLLPKTNIPPTGNPSVTIKKEIMASNTKLTEAEELAIAKKTAFASNLDSEHAFTNDLFNKKRTVHSKILQINQFSTARLAYLNQNTSSKKKITLTDQYILTSAMEVDHQSADKQYNAKNDQPEIIIISDDKNQLILVTINFIVYTESNNLPHIKKADKVYEIYKSLSKYSVLNGSGQVR
ncbi:hypothetical protein RCL_jg3749.t1 [Rhizophagus clarus]|uniref:Uncharacterized protein n=1 Tax=Rhizophagus clarus TaxID=94130 RepID=A0A8H3QSG5_9GLOM|nr:hypothetical protein RCL_jg3749.t1 [Rhizophagus clarus]